MQQISRRSSLFLLELIIAIAFFSIAAAVCVQFFAKSHDLEQESSRLNHAVHLATSAAEEFRYYDTHNKRDVYNIDNTIYTVTIDVNSSKTPLEAHIMVEVDNSPIYELKVLKNANMGVAN